MIYFFCQTSSVRAVLPSVCAQFLSELRFPGPSQSHHWPKLLWQKHLPETGEIVRKTLSQQLVQILINYTETAYFIQWLPVCDLKYLNHIMVTWRLVSDWAFPGRSDRVHGSDWFRCARKGGRGWTGGRNLHTHAEQRVRVGGPQHIYDRP